MILEWHSSSSITRQSIFLMTFLSLEFDKLGRQLENDESIRVVVLQSALPDFFIAHSGLGRVGDASKTVSHTRSFLRMRLLTPRRPWILEHLVLWQRGFSWKPMSPI